MAESEPKPKSSEGKSRTAFRTISEVAEELGIAQHVLRFWESKFMQVRPLKRGGGRRYYRPEDVDLLREIRTLLYDQGYTIKGAQKIIRSSRSKSKPTQQQSLDLDSPVPTAAKKPAASTPDPTGLATIRDQLIDIRTRGVALFQAEP